MANIAGSLRTGVVDKGRYSTTTTTWPLPGAVRVFVTQLGGNPSVWKNQGYYTAGSTWESWISVGTPSDFNAATGHGLPDFSQLQHYLVRA